MEGMIKKTKSLRFRFTMIFIISSLIFFISCVALNMLFLEKYYIHDKKNSLMEIVAEVETLLEEYHYAGNDDEMTLEEKEELDSKLSENMDYYWRKHNLNIALIGNDGTMIYSSMGGGPSLANRLYEFVAKRINIDQTLYEDEHYSIWVSGKQKETGNPDTSRKQGNNKQTMDAFGFYDSGVIFLMSMPMESFGESAAISLRFLAFTGAVVCALLAIYIFYMTKYMMAPITELTGIAKKMGEEDFSARYRGRQEDEIGLLGLTMNDLADKLENSISQLKAANVQLQKDIEEKEKIDEMRKEFLAGVSHELKTPIAIIQGYAEGLSDSIDEDAESREFYCDVIMDEAAKMNTMVSKLLRLNELEFGAHVYDMTDFGLEELVEGVIDSTRVICEQAGGSLSFVNELPGVMTCGDEFMLEDVVRNYISNACNHLDGERKIEVAIREGSKGRVRVSVRNSGSQIPADALDKIWLRFYKVDKARTREYGGSGIGLSIVKAIMDQHQCPYGVKNLEDGVEFWFELNKSKKTETEDMTQD